jgi:ketosteroid isomerase-like protein
MSQATNVELIRSFMASPSAGDWDAMFVWFAPDVELHDLQHAPDVPAVLRGHEAIRRVVASWRETYDECRTEVFEYVDADPWVICDTRWYGKGKGSGIPIEQRVADAYEVKDGKIVRAIMSYPSVAAALEGVRRSE